MEAQLHSLSLGVGPAVDLEHLKDVWRAQAATIIHTRAWVCLRRRTRHARGGSRCRHMIRRADGLQDALRPAPHHARLLSAELRRVKVPRLSRFLLCYFPIDETNTSHPQRR